MSNAEQPSNGPECPSCNAVMHPDAKFCHNCGAAAGGRPVGTQRNWRDIALVVVGVAAVSFGLTFVVGKFATEKSDVQSAQQIDVTRSPGAAMPSGQPVDLSTMTPRQAADRLFNRVIAADERGDTAEAMRFAPMALMAYERVERLDADAHYHVGLINVLSGNLDEARKQVEALKRATPDHLLGLVLAFSVAEKVGDRKGAADTRARFAAAYDAEILRGRPEYEAHRITIKKFHTSAMGSKTAGASNQIPKGLEPGARLFTAKCAGCHGPSASGSDKGPPLVHRIYEPSHHADATFYRAIRQGVRSHHWQFGNMAPVPGVTDTQIGQIVAYVRALQVKNGIK